MLWPSILAVFAVGFAAGAGFAYWDVYKHSRPGGWATRHPHVGVLVVCLAITGTLL